MPTSNLPYATKDDLLRWATESKERMKRGEPLMMGIWNDVLIYEEPVEDLPAPIHARTHDG